MGKLLGNTQKHKMTEKILKVKTRKMKDKRPLVSGKFGESFHVEGGECLSSLLRGQIGGYGITWGVKAQPMFYASKYPLYRESSVSHAYSLYKCSTHGSKEDECAIILYAMP